MSLAGANAWRWIRGHYLETLSLIILLGFLLSFLEARWYAADVVANLRGYLFFVFLGLLLWFALRKRWRWCIPSGSGLFLCGLLMGPAFLNRTPPAQDEGAPVLRIFCHNVNYQSGDIEAILDTIEQLDPDVIVLLEVGPRWQEPLKRLEPKYPHDLFEFRNDAFGMAFISRVPVRQTTWEDYSGYELLSVVAELEWQGEPITVIGAHPPPPVRNQLVRIRNNYLKFLAWDVARRKEPVVVVGDFNVALGSGAYGRLLRDGELRNVGSPTTATWRAFGLPFFGLRLDHIFATQEWSVRDAQVGDFLGSDHRWMMSELVLEE